MAETDKMRAEIDALARKHIADGVSPEVVAGELVSAGACLIGAKHGAKIAEIWLTDAGRKIGAAETAH
jgi:hypothetical protein